MFWMLQHHFKVDEIWITKSSCIAIVAEVWKKAEDDSLGRVDVYNIGDLKPEDKLYSTKFTEDWLVKRIAKETHPEYWL